MNQDKDPAALPDAEQDKKTAQIAREQAIFQMACTRKGITATTGPEIFKVSRPTFWAWMNSRHKIPHAAFVRLVELDNQIDPAQWERMHDAERRAAELGIELFAKPPRKRKKRKDATQIKTAQAQAQA